MNTQAETLKQWSKGNITGKTLASNTRVISVISGKGGVGKTSFTINLAVALSLFKKKVVVVDADLGLGNVDILLGLNTHFNLSHVLNKEKKLINIIKNGPAGIKVLPAASGLREMANLDISELKNLSDQFSIFDNNVDFVFFDSEAGIGNNVIQFALSSDEVVVITTPDPTAITDAYAIIKVLDNERINAKISLVVNMVKDAKEADMVYERIKTVCQRFLKININYLGYLEKDNIVVNAVRNQSVFVVKYPYSKVSNNIKQIASKLINLKLDKKQSGMKFFFKKFAEYIQR